MPLTHVLLWLFVLNLGIAFGAGLYEARISVARWLGPPQGPRPGWHPEEALRDDPGRRFWGFTTTLPLTLLTLANLWAAWHAPPPLRRWWLIAALAALADRGATFLYFIPRMLRLLRTADSPGARADMRQWARLNYLRIGLMLVAWLTALQALSLLKGQPG